MLGWFGAVDAAAKILAPIGAAWVLHLAGPVATLLSCAVAAALLSVLAVVAGAHLKSEAASKSKQA